MTKTTLQHLAFELEKRLPELEWQLSSIKSTIHSKSLPRNLFRHHTQYDNHSLMVEINGDLDQLKQHLNEASGLYLAGQLKQKINTLVALCHLGSKKTKKPQGSMFTLDRICTRSERLKDIEQHMGLLKKQQERLMDKLNELNHHNPEAYLAVQKDLGLLEKKLCQAQDVYDALIA